VARNRFVVGRCDGLLDEPRPGRPRVVGAERIKDLITATLETTPSDDTHWSTRSMAEHLGLSQSMVSRVWRAFGLAPHKQDSWKLTKDPLFVEVIGSLHARHGGQEFLAFSRRSTPKSPQIWTATSYSTPLPPTRRQR
jgi:Homeodomain-like domain